MRQSILISCVFITAMLFHNKSQAQGCSDAGACSLSDFKPDAKYGGAPGGSYLKFGLNYGLADYDITAVGAYAEYGRGFGENLGMSVKLTGLSQNGNDINVAGLSDIYVTGSYSTTTIDLILGAKIPLTDGGRYYNGLPLPMDYQSSLGTFDLIVGLGDSIGRLKWSVAYQQPLTQNNNHFDTAFYPEGSIFRTIPSTMNFDRAGDILARISYPMRLSKKLGLTPGLLPIYHIRADRYTDCSGIEYIIENSQGLTLNFNLFLDLTLTDKSAIQLALASPLVVREVRPDGLTRGFVANLEYRIRF